MTHYDAYVLCTAPRSGSTLICKMLTATRVAGKPESYFHRPSVDEWANKLGVETEDGASKRQVLRAIFQATAKKGRGGTELFGLRLQAHSLPFFCTQLGVLEPGGSSDAVRIQQVFGRTLFIHLTRADKIDQAISYLKAQQSGLWHMAADGSELERLSPHRAPEYDAREIGATVQMMASYDAAWKRWFDDQAVEPIHVSYERLSTRPKTVLKELLGHLGLALSHADGIEPGTKRLADRINEEWAARFRAENPRI